ncbi:L-serine ammonia-lyase, iron-sulfur-dependent, subunit beta [Caloramator sp. E03]|uniref:L-serine ammonia-lyase, iron-sulfur-dependent subunit beta n=1 Tax=Caloramator sp. E03 TaxID=2576307 RepID=UPI001110CFFE|nr:L-serine ammonia-lyase, iron-sulfur-dependent subunit beta [Caloramator sp. E03]QCX34454.1 L-serine ammonia-lyase, iron-sulfur-dependent, subunit beta [Caloramator sp. E03]
MKNVGVFDILGPVMIGPSSSHTAGAVRLGRAARCIMGEDFKKVNFYLHGSFAKTYKGHGTDRALVAGILGMDTDDERIRKSFDIAKERDIEINFIESDLGEVHPNTVKIEFINSNITSYIIGSSIGGGSIAVVNIDGEKVYFTGEYPTLLVKYKDKKGMISKISFAIALGDINIATLKVDRESKGEIATAVIETDNKVNYNIIDEISKLEGVFSVKFIDAI